MLWAIYPRGGEKILAQKCCDARISEGATWEELISAARHYSASVNGTEKRYIKLAKTFYGENRPFEDYVKGAPSNEPNRDTSSEAALEYTEWNQQQLEREAQS